MTFHPPRRPLSVLLASASAGGTIAAVRQLAAKGISVGVIASRRFSAAAWSRRAARRHVAPPESASPQFLEWLLAVGAADPGQILLPTSDQTAWLYTLQADLLGRYFCTYQPSIASMRRILDKKLFSDAARAAGLSVLPTWDPLELNDLVSLAPTLPYPILIKPRTHVNRLRNDKGIVVYSKSEIVGQYQRFARREQYRLAENPLMPDARRPLVQQFVRANEGVCSVSGFIDRTGELYVTRRSTKVFLRSQPVGIGVCFESRPADPVLANAVRRLCLELGYFGIFEVEFLRFEDQWAVIDFNPRLFNQMGMDIHRGMPLPLLACLDAAGEMAALRDAVKGAQAEDESILTAFCDRLTLRMILAARTLTARISRVELAYWRNWMKRNAAHCVDVVADESDPIPKLIHALSEIYLGLKAVPRFLRLTPRASSYSARAELRAGA
jgi:D-aspartate ligase